MTEAFSGIRAGLVAAVAQLALTACGGEKTETPSVGTAAATGADAGPAAALGTASGTAPGSSQAAEQPQADLLAKVVRATSWMPELDKDGFFFSIAPNRLPDAKAYALSAQQGHAMLPYLMFMWAKDASMDEKMEPVWVYWQALQSCGKAEALMDDLDSEFGDRSRGEATLKTIMQGFRSWAATQPADITLKFDAKLGAWDPNTKTFPLDAQALGYVSTLDAGAVKAAFPEMAVTGHLMSTYGSFAVYPTIMDFWCPSKDGKSMLQYSLSNIMTWRLQLGDYEPKRSLAGVPAFQKIVWPEIGMDRETAQAYAAANPSRQTQVSFTASAEPRRQMHGVNVVNLVADMKSATIIDTSGKMLATKTY